MVAKNHIHEQAPDSAELRKIRAAVRRSRRGLSGKLKKQYGLSITKETARPAMQRLTDFFSSGSGRGGRLSTRLAERNRRINGRFHRLTTFAGRQGGGGSCDILRFGLFRMKFNGCEVIAVYNAMRYLGYDVDIRDICYHFETNGSLLLGGFGVRPDALADYLAEHTDVVVTSFGSDAVGDYDALFAESEAAVLSFWNGPTRWTIHTVMLHHLPDGRVRAYNLYRNHIYSDVDSISALCSRRQNTLIPISLILLSDPDD